jgi:transcriptional regulator with XRE-family HTH domain
LAVNVRALRKQKGWSQDTLSERVGAHITYISRIETDSATPSFEIIQKIAAVFGVSVDTLSGSAVPNIAVTRSEDDKERAPLIEILRRLDITSKSFKDAKMVLTELQDGSAIAEIKFRRPILPRIVEGPHVVDDIPGLPERGSE